MVSMVMMPVPVIMTLGLTMPVGTAFRIKGCDQLAQLAAEFFDHVLNHVITPDTQRVAHQLGRQMPVAEMPGDLNKMRAIRCADFHQVFRFSADLNDPAVVENQAVTVMQMNGICLIQKE